jgi:hypothetical protein
VNLYAGAVHVVRGLGFESMVRLFLVVAGSEEEALGIFVRNIQESFPRSEGWSHSEIALLAARPDQLAPLLGKTIDVDGGPATAGGLG